MPNPERLPGGESPSIKSLEQLAGKIDMRKYSQEMRRAKKLAIRSLGQVVDPDEPTLTIEELRAKLNQELPGVSLSGLIMDERKLGY